MRLHRFMRQWRKGGEPEQRKVVQSLESVANNGSEALSLFFVFMDGMVDEVKTLNIYFSVVSAVNARRYEMKYYIISCNFVPKPPTNLRYIDLQLYLYQSAQNRLACVRIFHLNLNFLSLKSIARTICLEGE